MIKAEMYIRVSGIKKKIEFTNKKGVSIISYSLFYI